MNAPSESMLDYVRRKLADTSGQHVEIAHATGVPYWTMKKVVNGTTSAPRADTLQKLHDYFRRVDAEQAANQMH